MNAERWGEVCRLFDAARETPREERAAFLQRECRGDEDLESEVESLLAADEGESFLDDARAARGPRRGDASGPTSSAAKSAAEAWESSTKPRGAIRASNASVAVKLVKRGMDTDFILRRFESERRILAELDHPNIARVLDGGSTDDGLPYFVMELIRGKHLLDYCEEKKLGTAERLALFRQVCAAVTYAHQRLVIHRDIKPANILVTGDGVPRLLDFGIAKLLAGGEGVPSDRTETALRVLTPEYASPEQVLGKEITTSSDVYSLGVVLYELLTGERPYRISTRAPEEISAAVVGQEPAKPGTKTRLHRDLDHIVMMALRKEPERRYASAEQLSEDIRRHLEGLPVQASPDSFGYRAGKFIRRHRTGVAASALVAASLIGGLGLALVQMRAAERERQRAEGHLAEVRKLATSFLFEHHEAIKDLAGSTPARKLLVERGVAYLDRLSKETGNEPAFQRELAEAYEKLGNLQGGIGNEGSLGDFEGAFRSYRKALALREALAGRKGADPEDAGALARIHISLGQFVYKMGRKSETLAHYRKAVAIREARVALDPAGIDAKYDLGVAYHFLATELFETDVTAAIEAYRKEAGLFEEVAASRPDNRKARRAVGLAYQHVGSTLEEHQDHSQSVEALEKARSIQEALCVEDPANATYKKDLSSTLCSAGAPLHHLGGKERAVESYRECLRIRESLQAADPGDVFVRKLIVSAEGRLGRELSEVGEHAEAVERSRKALALAISVAAEVPRDVFLRADVAWTHLQLGASLRGSSVAAPRAEKSRLVAEARASLEKSFEIYSSLRSSGRLPATDEKDFQEVLALLKAFDEEAAKARG